MECSSKLSKVARRERGSPIQELSHLAQRCGAINLAEGLPDFPAPRPLKDAAIDAINSDLNQYRCWRVGWAVAPPCFASAIRNIHVKLTDSAPAPFQEAAVTALRSPSECFESLRKDYEAKRDFMIDMLQNFGFHIVFKPQGSFFVFVELPENCMLSDVEFVRELIEKVGVAAVPGRGFFHTSGGSRLYQQRYIRFAFCKSMATLQSAARRMAELMKHDNIFTKFE